MPRLVYLKLECLADEKWQAEHQSRQYYPQCPTWRSVIEAFEQGEPDALQSCVRCSKAHIVPTSFEPHPHQSALAIEGQKGLPIGWYKPLTEDEDYHYLASKNKLKPRYGGYGYYPDKGKQAQFTPPETERATIANAIDRIEGELSETLDAVERDIYEFGSIYDYEPDEEGDEIDEAEREQVNWLKELKPKLEGYLDQIQGLELPDEQLAVEITFGWNQQDNKPFAGGYSVNALKAIAQIIAIPEEQGRMLEVTTKGDRLLQIASELEAIEYC